MPRDWKLRYLPFLFRECPSGNAHWRSNHICYCCEGKDRNWTYVWRGNQKGWVPTEFALDVSSQSSSMSLSGQVSALDLIWNGIRTGLLIAIVVGIAASITLHSLWKAGQNYQKNVQERYEHISKTMDGS